MEHIPHAQSERLPFDPLSIAPGRFANPSASDDDGYRHPNDKRKKPQDFAHIVLPLSQLTSLSKVVDESDA